MKMGKGLIVAPFRSSVPSPDDAKIKHLPGCTAREWCQIQRDIPLLQSVIGLLDAANLQKPYKGFTTDGVVREGVYYHAPDEGAPVDAMLAAVDGLRLVLSAEQKEMVFFDSVEADDIRLWSNPELYVNPGRVPPISRTTPAAATSATLQLCNLAGEKRKEMNGK